MLNISRRYQAFTAECPMGNLSFMTSKAQILLIQNTQKLHNILSIPNEVPLSVLTPTSLVEQPTATAITNCSLICRKKSSRELLGYFVTHVFVISVDHVSIVESVITWVIGVAKFSFSVRMIPYWSSWWRRSGFHSLYHKVSVHMGLHSKPNLLIS